MMTFEEFLPKLEKTLSELSPTHRLAFSASCCERALPSVEAFARQTGRIDSGVVRQAVDEVWDFVGGVTSVVDVDVLRIACEEQLPPSDETHPLAAAATDTISMVDLLLIQVKEPNATRSRDIAGWAESIIDGYLQTGPAAIADVSTIPTNSLMQSELRRQAVDLDWLEGIRILDQHDVDMIRTRSFAAGSILDD